MIDGTEYNKLLFERFGGVLKGGGHGDCESEACPMEIRAILLGLHGDDPDKSPRDAWARIMADAVWSSDAARTAAMREVVLRDEPDAGWPARLAEATIRRLLPPMLRDVGLMAEAERCEREGTAEAAAAASAVRAAASAAGNEVLRLGVQIGLDVWEAP